jgi:[protein-PII] uridylyltransferase
MFSTPTRITFSKDARGRTLMELIAGDRPGLLSEVGKVLLDADLEVHTARIMTIGERAEDVFCISDVHEQPLDEETCDRLREHLHSALDSPR